MNDEMIDQLVFDLTPVKRLESPARRAARFALPAVAITIAMTMLAGPRPDLVSRVADPIYVIETALLLILFGGATFAALESGVPGARLKSAVRLMALAASAWLVLVATRQLAAPVPLNLSSGLACLRRTLVLGMVPGVVLFRMMRRSAPLESRISGALVLTAAGALAVLGTRFLCGKDDAVHVLSWHALPIAVLALLGFLVGRAWFGGSDEPEAPAAGGVVAPERGRLAQARGHVTDADVSAVKAAGYDDAQVTEIVQHVALKHLDKLHQ